MIEDCAHALGATYQNKKLGSHREDAICCWSFQAVKNLPMGDGGAITCWDPELRTWLNKLRWLGIDKDTVSRSSGVYSWEYDVPEVGYKYHLNDISATIGVVQLRHLEEDNLRRQQIATFYRENLPGVRHPNYKEDRLSSYHFYPVFVGGNRDEVVERLKALGISPGVHYKLNTKYPMYRDFERINGCKNAEAFAREVLTLPIHLMLSDTDLKMIADGVTSATG